MPTRQSIDPVAASAPAKTKRLAAVRKQSVAKARPKSAGRPRAGEVEARADELMQVAGQLFLAKGYSKVSLEMIAREARVAVRTIYVKFGGKSGLLGAVLLDKRQQYFSSMDMESDPRPLKEVLNDFAVRFHGMITSPEAVALQRMMAGEACSNAELIQTFFEKGPDITRATIARYLQRPDIRAQLRDGLPEAQLPVFLTNCILGDVLSRLLLGPPKETAEQRANALAQRMDLFYRAVLR